MEFPEFDNIVNEANKNVAEDPAAIKNVAKETTKEVNKSPGKFSDKKAIETII